MTGYFIVLDVGTTNIKGIAFSEDGEILKSRSVRTEPIFPKQGWVEQDPRKIMDAVYALLDHMIDKLGKPLGVGMTNQRSSSVVWGKKSGEPLYNVITWQDTRTEHLVEEYKSKSMVKFGRFLGDMVNGIAKLIPGVKGTERGAYLANLSYVSFGTNHTSMHLRWMMNNVEKVRVGVEKGTALFGTLDTWIAWNLTGRHVTDYTNASATGLFDPFYLKWSDNVLDIVDIPRDILPEIVSNDEEIGMVKGYDIPLLTMIADQQASLYMSGVESGVVNMTNGTGSFIDILVGDKAVPGDIGIYPMVALSSREKVLYLLEGFINSTGSAVDWMKNIGLIQEYSDIDEACEKSRCELVFIPALSGLATPYERPEIKGNIMNITLDTSKEDIVNGMMTGLSMRSVEVIESLERVSKVKVDRILADGGASSIDGFLQMTADLSGKRLERPRILNGSAYGTYMLAKCVHEGKDIIEGWKKPEMDKIFRPGKKDYGDIRKDWQTRLDAAMRKK